MYVIFIYALLFSIGQIREGSSMVYNWNVTLDFKEAAIDSNLIPAGTLDDCDIIDIR